MRGGFNFIEVIPSKYDNFPTLIAACWGGGKTSLFGPEGSLELFWDFIKKKKKKIIIFYASSLELIFPSLLYMHCGDREKIKFFAIKNKIYFVKIEVEGCVLIFKNLSLYLKKNLEELEGVGGNSYLHLGFYPGTKKKDLSSFQYTQPAETRGEGEEEWRGVLDILKPKGVRSDVPCVTSFFTQKNLSKEEIELEIRELPNKIKSNFSSLNFHLSKFNDDVSFLLRGWFFNYSLASISVEIFQKHFNDFEITIETALKEDEAIRPAYIGGRCEVFGNAYEHESVYHFDFESMYGQIMTEEFPTGVLELRNDLTQLGDPGFYFVSVISKKMDVPILPLKEKETLLEWDLEVNENEDRVFFPNGRFEGLFFSEELELFVKEGGEITKIHYAYIFKGKKKPLFRGFAKILMKLKEKGKSRVWKDLIVSFYGRLGMSASDSKIVMGDRESYLKETHDKDILQETWFDDIFLAEIKTEPNDFINSKVSYAAIITSKARIRLWKNLKEVKSNGGRILYCDTDSIFAAFCKTKPVLNKWMGEVFWDEKRGAKIDGSVFAGCRSYSITRGERWETRMSGLPRNSVSFKEFKESFYLSSLDRYEVKIVKKNIFKTEEWDVIYIVNLNNYNKRIFSVDKKSTTPLYKSFLGLSKDPFTN